MKKKRNATSWKPGQSGNPAGRPPNVMLRDIIARILTTGGEEDVERLLRRNLKSGDNLAFLTQVLRIVGDVPLPAAETDPYELLSVEELDAIISCTNVEDDGPSAGLVAKSEGRLGPSGADTPEATQPG